jgi:hypothetical protein
VRERTCAGVFIIVKQCVERHEYLCSKTMSIFDQLGYIFEAVASCLTRTKLRGTDIHGVRTCLDGGFSYFQVASRS